MRGFVIGATGLAWAVNEPWGETPVPELYVEALEGLATCEKVADGAEVFPDTTAHIVPGHTPGSLVFHSRTAEGDYTFTGDAVKNRVDLISGDTDMTYDPAISRRSIDMIWRLWRQRPGSVLAPGHNLPMVLDGDEPRYIGKRQAGIWASYARDMAP
jgi:N-acyl homoserine lactone hydrolase